MATSSGSGPQVVVKPPLEELKKRHGDMLAELKDLSTPMKQAAIFLDRWVQQNFKTEGGNVGGWKKLQAGGRYVPGFGFDPAAKILQDTSRLRASFLPFHSKKNAGIGSDLPYSEAHEEGSERLPKRRMLPKQAEIRSDVRKIIDNYIKKVGKKK